MKKPIISGSGIRGIFGESFTVQDACSFAAAFGELVGPGRVVVGRDTRKSGPAVEAAVCAGLMGVGCTPVLLGIVTTPTVQLEAMNNVICGGIAVTSSHNPGEWNALKLIGSDGVFLRAAARAKLTELLTSERKWVGYRECTEIEELTGSTARHVELVAGLPLVHGTGKKLKVILDVTGATAAQLAPAMMDALNVEWEMIFPDMTPEGDFPRVAEPNTESLSVLAEEVVKRGADAGFGFDPDGDRLALVDNRGRLIGEEYTVALALDHVLAHTPGPAVVNLSTSRLSEDAAKKHGCSVYRSPVGEVNVIEEMEIRGADIGGEGNGGVIHRDCHLGRDSAVGMAYTISYLREHPELSLSDWADSFPAYINMKKKVEFTGDFKEIAIFLRDSMGEPDDTSDGLWWNRGEGWVHIRPSGTEPVVRFIAENRGENRDILESDYALFRKALACVE
ncbi:MAG: phosphoglucosamine mutase [Candidatus Sabulitectum sp.]|nr:phosphoglucosamine mutase [Candidatus Sabulitectum sp.]